MAGVASLRCPLYREHLLQEVSETCTIAVITAKSHEHRKHHFRQMH